MRKHYLLYLLLTLLLAGPAAGSAQAQSGPYGNEWIVPGQQYYKIKVLRDGLYHLDYQYLTRAGISGVNPRQFQLWRRGREVAIYVGGNAATLDATTYLEFYGQRNDGKLDRGFYKDPAGQPHDLYSYSTDTAAYFLTWSTARQGKAMASSNLTGSGAPQAYRIQSTLSLQIDQYSNVGDDNGLVYQPWLETGEGFMSGIASGGFVFPYAPASGMYPDSSATVRNLSAVGPQPKLEVLLVGSSPVNHVADVWIEQPRADGSFGGTMRLLGTVRFSGFNKARQVFNILRSDIIPASGQVRVRFTANNTVPPPTPDRFRVGYFRVIYPQTSRWFSRWNEVSFRNDSTLSSGPAYYLLDSIPATVRGFDITDPYNVSRVEGTAVGTRQRAFVFPAATGRTRHLLLADVARPRKPAFAAERIRFRTISPAAHNFIIVSSEVLMRPAGAVANPVRAYADYRASAVGGGHDTLVVTSRQLYNQFFYGEESPLAVRQFGLFMAANARPKYLLLLGRGVYLGGEGYNDGTVVGFPRHIGHLIATKNLVPTSSRAASDVFFTSDWQNNSYVARMATGRVSAQTPQQVVNYLEKLKEHERPRAPEAWRKHAVHMAGGHDQGDFTQFQGFLNRYKRKLESRPFGGRVVREVFRTTTGALPVGVSITAELNAGLALVTYFGHGSSTTFDLNLPDINNPASGYNQQGKYPVMMYNGCGAGAAFLPQATAFSEDWTLAQGKGAVGFLAESSFGFESYLDVKQDLMYKLLFNDPVWYGKPIAAVQNEVNRQLQTMPLFTTNIGIAQLMNTIWQGDPALALYSPPRPDFATDDSRLQIISANPPAPVQASSRSFILKIGMSNLAKVTTDSVEISVTRRYNLTSGSRPDTIMIKRFRQSLRDTIYDFEIVNRGNVFGRNRFTVKLDYRNRVAEESETNNEATIEYNFLQGGVTPLSPPEFAILPSNTVRLVAQTNIVGVQARSFDMELDTIPTFRSAAPIKQTTTTTGALLASWRPTLPALSGRDSIVWYWRVRLQNAQAGEDTGWAVSSFRVIRNSPGGWSQSHYGQFRRDDRRRIDVAAPSGKWDFNDLSQSITLRTQGRAAGAPASFQLSYGIQTGGSAPYVANCDSVANGVNGGSNVMVVVFNGQTLAPVRNVSGGPYDLCGRAPSQFYSFYRSATDNINTASGQARLLTFLNNVPAGSIVAVVSVNRVNFSSFPAALKSAFTGLGSNLINTLQDGDPFAFIGQKGPSARPVQELSFSAGSSVPRTEQVITLNGFLRTRGASGFVASTRIGPAVSWNALHNTIRTEPSDSYTLRLVGIDSSNVRTVLNPNVTVRTLPLNGFSARTYPYMQLELVMRDTLNRTAPQLKQWLVTYTGVPEGVVRRDLAPAGTYDAAPLTAAAGGGFITVPVFFENVSHLNFLNPLVARVTVRSGAVTRRKDFFYNRVLRPDSVARFNVNMDVRGLTGALVTEVDVNPRLQPELNYFNNQLLLPTLTVVDRNVPPVLDVAFDGKHILNGEIVSPAPIITVLLQDEDRLRPMKREANNFDIFLTRPGSSTPEQISMSSGLITFQADSAKGTARIEFQPGKLKSLDDGVYKLEVQGRDVSGTAAATELYSITFQVINNSTITNVYPYPNPITSKARFVFTLTGRELPRDMKIQIITLTGKVVREIDITDIGQLRIGSNITEYAWDGTDQFGDRLANGTYLYRVVLDNPDQFENRKAAPTEKAFKKDWGKLVLIR
ncbi:C25 family cysteine peptidase [Hymenobacter sp. BT175]|uniref:putative type IX secretion system sortase PorU2 n=1 Tax=Hymenobacter translucens TaxID=2886507 RepID=UPI001D0DF0B0|nr:C25 family cysteine peptidase [Hymenobacter translucens]MCC2546649.1 C25 family cysteine peptidase [Hymenobacter translucens]